MLTTRQQKIEYALLAPRWSFNLLASPAQLLRLPLALRPDWFVNRPVAVERLVQARIGNHYFERTGEFMQPFTVSIGRAA